MRRVAAFPAPTHRGVLAPLVNWLARHRRPLCWLIIAIAIAGGSLLAGHAVAAGHEQHGMDDAAALCMSAGTCVAVVVAVVGGLMAARRPSWPARAASPWQPAVAPAGVFTPTRAGPSALLQVFRN
jgi:hypothetical protein